MENPLVGKTISKIYLAEDMQAIKFETNEKDVIAWCDGDCCSSTWIENVEESELVIGTPVLEVVDLDLGDKNEENDGELIQHYGLAIVTSKGKCVIDFRNSSNGYYGGNLVWDKEDGYYYGGVYGQNISTEVWKELQPRKEK